MVAKSSGVRDATIESLATAPLRVLMPIDATDRALWGIEYVLARHRAGRSVEATLLFVAEPVTSWQVLRFRTQAEIARFQALRGELLLEQAAELLRRAGIATRSCLREGEVVFQVLDAAEQLGCDEIVLPRPGPDWARWLSRGVVRGILRSRRDVPVVLVDASGHALAPNGRADCRRS